MDSQIVLTAVKGKKSFDCVGSPSAVPAIARQMEKYGWAVTVREEGPTDPATRH